MLWQLAYTELFFLKNCGQILMEMISIKLLQFIKKLREILEAYDARKFKKRLTTSLFLFLLVFFIYISNLIFVYSLIILGVLSIIEFLTITNKIVKNKIYFFISILIFVIYIYFFCFLFIFFYSHPQLKVIIFSLLLCCAFSDIGGYIFGKFFKGPKLTKISPNKTIAGCLGSLCLSCFSLSIILYIISL